MGKVYGTSKRYARTKIEIREREGRVMELRKQGLSFDEIARLVGYRSQAGAYNAYKRVMDRTIQQPSDEIRKLELDRLDEMLKAIWPQVLAGKGWAVEKALMIQDRRAKYLGLDAPAKTRVEVISDSAVDAEIAKLMDQIAAQEAEYKDIAQGK